jgi:hypothetical protein
MHDTKVVLKDGRKFCGPIWQWHPTEGYFTICDYDVANEPTRIELKDVASAKTVDLLRLWSRSGRETRKGQDHPYAN